jgi:hypothetical protein
MRSLFAVWHSTFSRPESILKDDILLTDESVASAKSLRGCRWLAQWPCGETPRSPGAANSVSSDFLTLWSAERIERFSEFLSRVDFCWPKSISATRSRRS